MPTIDEKRKAVLEQAIRDMGNYGVKLRKPEELPDFDQPVDYEEEKKRFEPVKVEEQKLRGESQGLFSTVLSRNRVVTNGEGYFYRRESSTKWEKQGTGSNYPSFRGNIYGPFAIATAKPYMYQRKLNESWASW